MSKDVRGRLGYKEGLGESFINSEKTFDFYLVISYNEINWLENIGKDDEDYG